MTLRIRPIDKAQDFMALEPVWSRLTDHSGQTSPFLSYDWFWCCWHGVVPQRRPEILVVEDGGTPAAIIPLMHWKARVHGFPIRYMSFLDWPHTPTVDLLTTHPHDQVIELFLEHLTSRSDWDIARLQNLPVASPTVKALEHLLPGRLPWRLDGHVASPYVAIDGDWENFSQTMIESCPDIHQPIHARLQRAGDLKIEEHRIVDLRSSFFQETLAVMTLQPHHGHVIATLPRQREFFRALTQRAAKNGWLSLWTLRLDGHIIAIEYQLRFHGRVQVLAAGEEPSYRALRPWPELNLAILQSLFQSRCASEYSLGPAVQDDRFWWANDHHQTVHFKLYRPSLYTRVLAQLDGATVLQTR